MKIVKPDKLSLLQRTVEHDGRAYLIVSLVVGFSFDAPRGLLSEVELWKLVADELAVEGGILDEGHSKHRGEVLVTGRFFAPRGEPTPISFVRVKLGAVDKRLAVLGDRRWLPGGVPTEPEPVTEMPLDWTRAFGGKGFAPNPLGRGIAPRKAEGHEPHRLPNVETPGRLVASPRDRPAPAGLGPIDLTWPQRSAKAGTYDQKWVETRFPGFAADMDPTFFNAAPDDQQIEGYFQGDETFLVENMHPSRSLLESHLPGVVTRAFVTQRQEDGTEVFRELRTRLDTVRLIPHRATGVLVFRGMLSILEDDAADVVHLVAACEAAGAPRTVEHYQDALAQRLDRSKSALLAMKDDDLMPAPGDGWKPRTEKTDIHRMVQKEDLLSKNLRRKQEKEFAAGQRKILAMGLDPKDFGMTELPPEPDPVDPDDVDAILQRLEEEERAGEENQKLLATKNAEMEARTRARFAANGQDFDAAVEKARKDGAGPPKFRAAAQLEMLRENLAVAREGKQPLLELEAKAADPAYHAQLLEQEKQLFALYRRGAHLQHPVEGQDAEQCEMVRAEIVAAHHNGIALPGRDFTGVDLSGLELRGIDLSGAFLESADLTGTDLSEANLEGAVLAHATLRRTKLVGANLKGTNLGGATLDEADLSKAQLDSTVLMRARVRATSFRGAKISGVQLVELEVGEGIDLGDVVARELVVIKVSLAGAKLDGADLTKSFFYEVDVAGADFSGVVLEKASFVTCPGKGASFRGARMDGCTFMMDCSLEEADFTGASARRALFRGSRLAGATFTGANLEGADLSSCDLTGANLENVTARGAMMIRANLTGAKAGSIDLLGGILQKARLYGTDLRGASLFRVDLSRVRTDGGTKLSGANLTQARTLPRHVDEPR